MADYFITLCTAGTAEPLVDAIPFDSLEDAYLDACAAVPSAAADLLRERRNPFRCAFLISNEDGLLLMEVPFTEVLPPSEQYDPSRAEAHGRASAAVRLRVQIDRSRRLIRQAEVLHDRAARFCGKPAPCRSPGLHAPATQLAASRT